MLSSWNKLRNCHQDEVGLVIGNGPSLKKVKLDFLRKYPSFGTNRIYLLEGFTPTYYAAVNPLVIEQFIVEISKVKSEAKFIAAAYASSIKDSFPLNSAVFPSFSRNPEEWIYEGYTVTYVCLQLAFFMGFTTVLLVGVDHKYKFDGEPNQEMFAEGKDENHFHPKYFSDGVLWHNPDLRMSARAYEMAKHVYNSEGRKIINLTPGSSLDVFERGEIKKW